MVGKVGRLGQAYRPVYHLMPMLYASVAYALRENDRYLASTSKSYRALVKKAKQQPRTDDDVREINFALGQTSRQLHQLKVKYRIPASLREELDFITALLSDKDVQLATHIGHIVPRDHDWAQAADSCKTGGGGWSTGLKFWWHLHYPEEVVRRAYLPNNKSGKLISINVLEMVCIILNFAAAICVCAFDKIDLSTHPVLLNFCDNTSACSWVNKFCKHSMIGRRLGRMFVGLLMSTKLAVQAEWISTTENEIADEISRLKRNLDGVFDYSNLKVSYPSLSACRQFQPSATLLGMIWDIILFNRSPDPLTVRKLEPCALGKITS